MPPPVFLSPLRDLPNKVTLSPALEQSIKDIVALEETSPEFATQVSSLADQLNAFLDGELSRLTEQRIALGDSNSMKQRLLGDPRRQVDQAMGAVKARFQAEKSEWGRRLQKQQAELLDSVELELRKLAPETRIEGDRGLTDLPEKFRHSFPAWLDENLGGWGKHLGTLLPTKLKAALEPDLDVLGRLLGEPVTPRLTRPAGMSQTPVRIEYPDTLDSSEVPTTSEAFFETFKNGLNTVAMLAGLVIIPVVGSLSERQPTHIRAAIISAFIFPVVFFAAVQTRTQRRKLLSRLTEKAQDKIRKQLEAYAKTRVERFGKEADRHIGNWLSAVQGDVTMELEGQVSSVFGRKEASVAGEIAKVAILADKLQDQISAVKQARSMISNSIVPEAKKRLPPKA